VAIGETGINVAVGRTDVEGDIVEGDISGPGVVIGAPQPTDIPAANTTPVTESNRLNDLRFIFLAPYLLSQP
jgi:hypothetical protein